MVRHHAMNGAYTRNRNEPDLDAHAQDRKLWRWHINISWSRAEGVTRFSA